MGSSCSPVFKIHMPKIKSVEKKLNVKPLMGYLLIEPDKGESQTASGIILPESTQEKPAQGKVLAVGDDFVLPNGQVLRAPVKVGDEVVYKKWGGDEIKINGEEL